MVTALSRDNGVVLWETKLVNSGQAFPVLHPYTGSVIVGPSALDPGNGSLLWTTKCMDSVPSLACTASTATCILYGVCSGAVVAVDCATGDQLWRGPQITRFAGSPPVSPDLTSLYWAYADNENPPFPDTVTVISAADGTVQSTCPLSTSKYVTSFADVTVGGTNASNTMMVLSGMNWGGFQMVGVAAFDPHCGMKWINAVDATTTFSQPIIDAAGSVYIAGDSTVTGFSTDGHTMWTFATNGYVSRCAIGSDGALLVASRDGYVYSLVAPAEEPEPAADAPAS